MSLHGHVGRPWTNVRARQDGIIFCGSKFGGPSMGCAKPILHRHSEICELFHLSCTMRLSSTMTRLALNRNARARRAHTRLTKPLWAGKSSANASASVRGQQGEPAQVLFARIWAAQTGLFGDVSLQNRAKPSIASRCAIWLVCGCVYPLSRLLRQRAASCLIAVGGTSTSASTSTSTSTSTSRVKTIIKRICFSVVIQGVS